MLYKPIYRHESNKIVAQILIKQILIYENLDSFLNWKFHFLNLESLKPKSNKF